LESTDVLVWGDSFDGGSTIVVGCADGKRPKFDAPAECAGGAAADATWSAPMGRGRSSSAGDAVAAASIWMRMGRREMIMVRVIYVVGLTGPLF
jgi:hypothetical protein